MGYEVVDWIQLAKNVFCKNENEILGSINCTELLSSCRLCFPRSTLLYGDSWCNSLEINSRSYTHEFLLISELPCPVLSAWNCTWGLEMPQVSTSIPFYLIQEDVTGKTKDFSKYITVIFLGAGLSSFVCSGA